MPPKKGAPTTEAAPNKKNPEDRLAPMPLPKLDPSDGSTLFVPSDVNRKMREEHAARLAAKKAAEKTQAAPAPAPAPAPVAPTPAPTAPQPKSDFAQNRDAAVDPIFPKSAESKAQRKTPKAERNFDLRNVFIDFDDETDKPAPTPRKHAPVPPEVPLAPAQKKTNPAAPVAPGTPQRPTSPNAATSGASPAQRPATRPTPAGAPSKAPSTNAIKPAAPGAQPVKKDVAQPIFRHADNTQKKDFGLSSEEFEKLEAERAGIPSKSGTKPAPKAPATPVKTAAGKDAAKKPAAPKKYVFPPISYLQPGEPMTAENRAEIQASMTQLAETLTSFRVRVQEINYSCGPTVTRYEVILAPGVRVSTIKNLADDIALSLRSSGGVRIEAPIPGTNAVGIEVPNKTRSTIYLRDLIESKEFAKASSKLAACLGADIAGDPIIFDIVKMPHLLVAGTTGSGKSVCINCIIMSLLYKVRPDEVKFILIDPKKVEFSIYKNIPHLMAPVVTTPKDAAGALQAAVEEMERRFEIFESIGVRDIKGYNAITADDPDMPYMPHIVIIIDELADLMMTAKNEVETAICRIAQKARAAGMHLIIGTQRPSADVVTGLIKANVPSSIAFAVKSQVDSRVILDHGGAEALTGRGDMLFVPIGAMRDTRVQGAFVDDKEVEKICEFIRATNGTAQYDEKFISKLKELAAQCGNKGKNDDLPPPVDGEKTDDPKYADAVRVAIEEGRISTSLLQRKLEVGYSRAAKLVDRMQSEGIVSPPDGSKPRSILITKEQYFEKFFDNAEDGQ
ncbi:MAG: DNA translocase FtsK [Clostridia bacterium]|nr:DNA translocase FtsK [Clostridia bacterium]